MQKTILKLEVDFSLYEKFKLEHGSWTATNSRYGFVDIPIEIGIKTEPDYKMGFLFDTDLPKNFTKDSSLTLISTDNGILKSVNITTTDKIIEMVTKFANTVVNVASKFVTGRRLEGLPTEPPPVVTSIPMPTPEFRYS